MSTPETLFETHWIRMLRIGHWDYVVRPQSENCVGILAITPEEEIVLIEQFRIPLQKRVIEIPAGIVGDEPEHLGESLAETARRELLEETGYRAATMEKLIVTPTSAGLTSEYIHLFQARRRRHRGGGHHRPPHPARRPPPMAPRAGGGGQGDRLQDRRRALARRSVKWS